MLLIWIKDYFQAREEVIRKADNLFIFWQTMLTAGVWRLFMEYVWMKHNQEKMLTR